MGKLEIINRSDVELIVYDFDGVMTDNRVIVSQDGTESVIVNRSDGLGVCLIRKMGIQQLLLSTETNPVVKVRADKLSLEIISACDDKAAALKKYCLQHGYDLQKVIFVGNDLNDMEAMTIVGYPVAPRDAAKEILSLAKLVTETKGGYGVVRELAQLLQ